MLLVVLPVCRTTPKGNYCHRYFSNVLPKEETRHLLLTIGGLVDLDTVVAAMSGREHAAGADRLVARPTQETGGFIGVNGTRLSVHLGAVA